MKSTIPAPAAKLLDFLAQFESKGNYLAYFGNTMNSNPLPGTLDEVLQWQRDFVRSGKKSSAIGRYQFMPPTLRDLMRNYNIPGTERFTPDLQDQLAYYLLIRRKYEGWMAGTVSDSLFADQLSMEWASLPYQSGKSYYDGDGLNHSLVSRGQFIQVIKDAKGAKAPAPAVGQGAHKEPPMAPQIAPVQKAHSTDVNFIQGLENFASNIVSQLESTVKVVVSPNNDVTLKPQSGGLGSVFSSISDAQLAISELQELISDIHTGKWQEVPEDVLLLLKTIFSILSRFGINVPVVSGLIAMIPALPAVEEAK